MKVLAAHASGFAGHVLSAAAVLFSSLAALPAAAQDLQLPPGLSGARPGAHGRMELSASTMPLFDGSTGATHSTRLDMFWLPPRRPNLGLALGLTNSDSVGLRPLNSPTGPAVDVGLHWRYEDAYRIDVTAWRRMASPEGGGAFADTSSSYGARFEMQVKSSGRRSFALERGLLGFQLEGGARIGVRRTGGHPMLYYRTSF
jgi:hypothetical protein